MKTIMKVIRFSLLCLILGSLLACAPRGETRSLDQVLEAARERYGAVSNVPVDPHVGQSLKAITQHLADLEKPLALPQFSQKSAMVADLLDSLDRKAGYTSRASLADIANQYRGLSSQANGQSNIDANAQLARARLLVARTYGLLASELETTKFAIG